MPALLGVIGILTSAVGIFKFINAANQAGTILGAEMLLLGLVISGIAFYLLADPVTKSNILKNMIAVFSGGAAAAGLAVALFSLPGWPATWFRVFAGFVAATLGIAGVIYGARYQTDAATVEIGKDLGFEQADSGLTGADGKYDIKGRLLDLDVLVNVNFDDGMRSPRLPSSPKFTAEVLCRPRNPYGIRLVIYPKSPAGLLKPIAFLPPVLENVTGWDSYVVRGEPADVALKAVSHEKGEALFNGLSLALLDLNGSELKCRFEETGRPDKKRIGQMTAGAAELAHRCDIS